MESPAIGALCLLGGAACLGQAALAGADQWSAYLKLVEESRWVDQRLAGWVGLVGGWAGEWQAASAGGLAATAHVLQSCLHPWPRARAGAAGVHAQSCARLAAACCPAAAPPRLPTRPLAAPPPTLPPRSFVHTMSLDFLCLTTLAPFWMSNDAQLRGWDKRDSLVPLLSCVPVLGPALYLLLRPRARL